MKRLHSVLLAALVPAGLAAGCGPGRTAAATQPTPAAFDPAKSDTTALGHVEAGLAALGGGAAWDGVKQLSFEAKYLIDGTLKSWYRHHWDRWNGRHNFQSADLATDDGTPGSMQWMEVFYDLFDADAKPHASYGGREVSREDANKFRGDARKRLAEDGYFLTMIYKLKDPGVMLADGGEVATMGDVCAPSCVAVKVTFDPAVGTDTWVVNYNTGTKLPEVIEKQTAKGRIGYRIVAWIDAGGLKFPAKLQNLGLPGEVFEFGAIEIAEPDDRLFIPQVEGD